MNPDTNSDEKRREEIINAWFGPCFKCELTQNDVKAILAEYAALRDKEVELLQDEIDLKQACIKGMGDNTDQLGEENISLRSRLAQRNAEIEKLRQEHQEFIFSLKRRLEGPYEDLALLVKDIRSQTWTTDYKAGIQRLKSMVSETELLKAEIAELREDNQEVERLRNELSNTRYDLDRMTKDRHDFAGQLSQRDARIKELESELLSRIEELEEVEEQFEQLSKELAELRARLEEKEKG